MTRLLMAVGIIIALCSVAAADPAVFYPGSRCFRIDKTGAQAGAETAKEPRLWLPVVEVAEANRDSQRLDVCRGELGECRAKAKPKPRWVAPAKWLAVGTAIGAAFVAGVWVGR